MSTVNDTDLKTQALIKKIFQKFFTPSQYEVKTTDREILAQGNAFHVPYNDGELAVTTWGHGEKTVLLMHGWGGARAQMTGFVNPLLSAGYRVVAYDQPAHGESDGKTTNILEIAPTMKVINEKTGSFDAVIAHSFGTLITSYALTTNIIPNPAKLVYFGAFNRLLDSIPRFQAMANLPDALMDGMRALLFETFGRGTLELIEHEKLVKEIRIPALMYHDTKDEVTPIEDSRSIARAWENAKFVETAGLGHRGALQSSEVHQQVVNFLQE